MDPLKIYIPFSKKNDDEMIVEGFATTESIDSQGEIVSLDGIKKALPNYMKYGNIREMHQWSAVGKAIKADFKDSDDGKGLYLTAKIVDKDAWEKCKQGVYNGFSIGGKVTKKLENVVKELDLNEISVVDRPANPDSEFSIVKADEGSTLKKTGPFAPTALDEEPPHLGIKFADRLIAVATSLTFMMEAMQEFGRKSTAKNVGKAISALKIAAVSELQSEKVAVEKALLEKKEEKTSIVQELSDKVEALKNRSNMGENWMDSYFAEHKNSL